MPVPTGHGEDVHLDIEVVDETNAIVRPYPFNIDPLIISFPARVVPDRVYHDRDEFLRHFYQVEQRIVTYLLHSKERNRR